jgi:hypothetical protein
MAICKPLNNTCLGVNLWQLKKGNLFTDEDFLMVFIVLVKMEIISLLDKNHSQIPISQPGFLIIQPADIFIVTT